MLYGGYAHFHKWVLGREAVERFVAEAERSWGTGATLASLCARDGSTIRISRLVGAVRAAVVQPDRRDRAGADERRASTCAASCRAIHVPTLVLHRAEDARVDPEAGRYLARQIPGARLSGAARGATIRSGPATSTAAVDAIEEFLTGMPPHAGPRRVLAALLAVRVVGAGRGAGRA